MTLLLHLVTLALFSREVIMQETPENPEKCEQIFSYLKPSTDNIFKSPSFPKPYPERMECSYFFQAIDEGRVKIDFDIFELEEPSDNGCQFDYIDISNIDEQGYKTLMFRYCGTKIPQTFVSLHSKMEIIFHSDFTKSGHGFLAHYEFLGENWHPFEPSTVGCGPGYLTGNSGLITSPGYNHKYPDASSCTWIIKVKKENKVLVHLLDMDLKQSDTNKGRCSDSYLLIFDGFATPEKMPNFQECGQLINLPTNRREYLAATDRVVIRFESGEKNKHNNIGFKISWTAVQLTLSGNCKEFECTGSQPCLENPDQLCNRDDTHFCIHSSLKCNEVPNCGAADKSDEEKCLALLMVAYIAAPIAGVLLVGVIIVYCYCRCCRRHQVKYSMAASQEPPPPPPALSSPPSSHLPLRSLERSPSITRSSCIMYSTSFTDCSTGDQHAGDNHVITPQQHNEEVDHISNVPTVRQTPNTLSTVERDYTDDHKPDYQTHRKRPSYHMMRELCYEDGNIVIADI